MPLASNCDSRKLSELELGWPFPLFSPRRQSSHYFLRNVEIVKDFEMLLWRSCVVEQCERAAVAAAYCTCQAFIAFALGYNLVSSSHSHAMAQGLVFLSFKLELILPLQDAAIFRQKRARHSSHLSCISSFITLWFCYVFHHIPILCLGVSTPRSSCWSCLVLALFRTQARRLSARPLS